MRVHNRLGNEFCKEIFMAHISIHSGHPPKPTSVRFTELFIKNWADFTMYSITILISDLLRTIFGRLSNSEPDDKIKHTKIVLML